MSTVPCTPNLNSHASRFQTCAPGLRCRCSHSQLCLGRTPRYLQKSYKASSDTLAHPGMLNVGFISHKIADNIQCSSTTIKCTPKSTKSIKYLCNYDVRISCAQHPGDDVGHMWLLIVIADLGKFVLKCEWLVNGYEVVQNMGSFSLCRLHFG